MNISIKDFSAVCEEKDIVNSRKYMKKIAVKRKIVLEIKFHSTDLQCICENPTSSVTGV